MLLHSQAYAAYAYYELWSMALYEGTPLAGSQFLVNTKKADKMLEIIKKKRTNIFIKTSETNFLKFIKNRIPPGLGAG